MPLHTHSPIEFGLTVPFELSPAFYSAYLRANDPESEFGIPVVTILDDEPTKVLANPQPGFIVIVDRAYWSHAADRREQRRGECEDGISWLSSSSTRPCVITLPCGRKLVTEYLYRRDRGTSDEASHSLQKHEIWLLPESYELVTKNGDAPTSSSRTSVRRPTTPMPSRCLVHYIDKKHAVHHMQPPRVHRVLQPASSYTRPEELFLARTQLEPLVGEVASHRNMQVVHHRPVPLASTDGRLSPVVEELANANNAPLSRASPADLLFQALPPRPARVGVRSSSKQGGGPMRAARSSRAARSTALSTPRAALHDEDSEGGEHDDDDLFGFGFEEGAITEMRTSNPNYGLNAAALGLATHAIRSQDLARFIERDEDILGALFSFESS